MADSKIDYTLDELTILGIAEIAEILQVKPRTPHAWKFRGHLPPYDYPSVNGTEAWDRSTILRWAITGPLHGQVDRCPPELVDEALAACTKGERNKLAALADAAA